MAKKKASARKKTNAGRKALVGGAAAITLLIGVPAFAATTDSSSNSPTAQHFAHEGVHVGHHKTATAAFGTVQSINGSVITLSHKTKSGIANITVTTTSSTTYKKNGVADIASDITIGDRIVAMGVKDNEGNITNATSVNIFTPL